MGDIQDPLAVLASGTQALPAEFLNKATTALENASFDSIAAFLMLSTPPISQLT